MTRSGQKRFGGSEAKGLCVYLSMDECLGVGSVHVGAFVDASVHIHCVWRRLLTGASLLMSKCVHVYVPVSRSV